MTPKEKAKELVDKFKFGDIVTEKLQVVNINIYAQLFALRAVDEILDTITGIYDYDFEKLYPYWEEVKQEISNLYQLTYE